MNNKDVDEILKKFGDIKYVSDEDIENMDFYELAYYTQCLNNIEDLYNDINSLRENN